MIRKWFGIASLTAIAVFLLNTSGCARDQKLVSVSLSPSQGFVFEGFNAAGQFTAYGSYIHPPENKDISNQVTWSLNIQNFGTVSQAGLVTYTRNDGCGKGDVSATFKNSDGSVIVGTAPVSGANEGSAACQ
jgi:hypothetical protein